MSPVYPRELPAPTPFSVHGQANQQLPETFWRKTFDDPVATFTLWLTVMTAILAVSTIGLWIVTWLGARKQARDMGRSLHHSAAAARAASTSNRLTRELFSAEQRPWIYIDIVDQEQPRFGEDGNLYANLKFVVKNNGKSSAFKAAATSTGFIHFGYKDYQEYFDGVRTLAERHVSFKGKTIFPGEDRSFQNEIFITYEQIDEINNAKGGDKEQFIAVSYKYLSFSGQMLETSRIWYFGIGTFNNSIPINQKDIGDKLVSLHLFGEVIV